MRSALKTEVNYAKVIQPEELLNFVYQDISVPEMLTAMDKVAKPHTARAKTARAKARKQAGQSR
jgi:hypothetical protein